MKIPDPIYDQYYFSSPENQESILRVVENLIAEQKKELSNRKMYQCGYNDAKKELIEEILKLGQTDGGYRDMVWKELIESLK